MHDWSLASIAVVIVAYAALSRRLDRTPITAAVFFVTCGLALGSKGLGWISLTPGGEQVRLLAEVTLTLVLFSDASRIDLKALRREYVVPARLLGIGLPLTIAAGCGVAALLYGQFNFGEALLLAIILAPTDAALGQAVVTDVRVPSRIRQGLNVESGLNDGICVPLLFIALAIADAETQAKTAAGAVELVAEAIGYGLIFGLLSGVAGAVLLRQVRERGLAESTWLQAVPVGTAAAAYGLAAPLGGSGFIAAFVAGLSFGALSRGAEEETLLLEELGGVSNAVTFVVFGAVIVGPALSHTGWKAAVYAVLSLTAVRMVPVAIAFVGTRARLPTVAFTGWFGPRGLASIVFTVIVLEEAHLSSFSTMQDVVVLTILLSVYAHGFTARALTSRYVSWYRSHPDDRLPEMEAVPAEPQRWRRRGAAV